MSNKSRYRHPHAPPLPVLSEQQVRDLLIGPTPTCCAAHQQHHAAQVRFIAGPGTMQPCFLCGGTDAATIRGFFVPFDSQKYGAAPARRRMLAYNCCEPCWVLPDREQRIEQAALADVRYAQARAAWILKASL